MLPCLTSICKQWRHALSFLWWLFSERMSHVASTGHKARRIHSTIDFCIVFTYYVYCSVRKYAGRGAARHDHRGEQEDAAPGLSLLKKASRQCPAASRNVVP